MDVSRVNPFRGADPGSTRSDRAERGKSDKAPRSRRDGSDVASISEEAKGAAKTVDALIEKVRTVDAQREEKVREVRMRLLSGDYDSFEIAVETAKRMLSDGSSF